MEEAKCFDCADWCGRCSEPTNESKKSVGRIASSDACAKFQPRTHVKEAHV